MIMKTLGYCREFPSQIIFSFLNIYTYFPTETLVAKNVTTFSYSLRGESSHGPLHKN